MFSHSPTLPTFSQLLTPSFGRPHTTVRVHGLCMYVL